MYTYRKNKVSVHFYGGLGGIIPPTLLATIRWAAPLAMLLLWGVPNPAEAADQPQREPASTKKPPASGSEQANTHPAYTRLQNFLDRLKSVEGKFQQKTANPDTPDRADSSGSFVVAKPSKFRWDYETPFQQTVLSDGKTVWYYEPDLKQATKTSATRLDNTPATFLSSGGKLDENFQWEPVKNPGDPGWSIRLYPKKEGSIKELTITLHPNKEELDSLDVLDSLGHRSRITFADIKYNANPGNHRFEFTPPIGVDIIADDKEK